MKRYYTATGVGPILMLVLLNLTSVTWAGSGAHGGNGVVCFTDSSKKAIASVELFDYWEKARELKLNVKLDMGGPDLTVQEKIDVVIDRLRTFDPVRADQYKINAQNILGQLQDYLTSEIELADIQDDNGVIRPTGLCIKTRFAVQLKDPKPYQKKFLISALLYQSKATSNDARAGIILHEVIYQEAIDLGQTTSDNTRYFNYLISTNYLAGNSIEQYLSLLEQVGFPVNNVMPVLLPDTNQIIYLDRESLKYSSDRVLEEGVLNKSVIISDDLKRLHLSKGTVIKFHKSGRIKYISLNQSSNELYLRIYGKEYQTQPEDFWFYDKNSGSPYSAKFFDPVAVVVAGVSTTITPHTDVGFNSDGYITSGKLSSPVSTVVLGIPIIISASKAAYFTRSGKIYGGLLESPVLVRIGNQEIQITAFLADSSYFYWINISQPTLLPVVGGKYNWIFRGDAELNKDGEVLSGRPDESISIQYFSPTKARFITRVLNPWELTLFDGVLKFFEFSERYPGKFKARGHFFRKPVGKADAEELCNALGWESEGEVHARSSQTYLPVWDWSAQTVLHGIRLADYRIKWLTCKDEITIRLNRP